MSNINSRNIDLLPPLVKDKNGKFNLEAMAPSMNSVVRIAESNSANVRDAKNIRALLPELNLIENIIVSSVLSTNSSTDLNDSKVVFKLDKGRSNNLVYGKALKVIENYFLETHNILDLALKITTQALFHTGSYPIALMPADSIKKVIKQAVGTESFTLPKIEASARLNLIEDFQKVKASSKNPAALETLTITDSLGVLAAPTINKYVIDREFDKKMASFGLESFVDAINGVGSSVNTGEYETTAMLNSLYKDVNGGMPAVSLPIPEGVDLKSDSIPLVMHIPSTAVINITVPGDPTNVLASFIVIDENGYPYSSDSHDNYLNRFRETLKAGKHGAEASSLISRAATIAGITGTNGDTKNDLDLLLRSYETTVEATLIKSLQRTALRGGEIQNLAEITKIMFARTLAKQNTTLLFVHNKLMHYFAFDYDELGIGVSLVERSKLLSGLRITNLISNAIINQRNAIVNTMVDITLDEDVANPQKQIDFIKEHISKARGLGHMFDTNPVTGLDILSNSGIFFNISGSEEVISTKISLEESNGNRPKVDSEYTEDLRRQWIMMFGLVPELIDQAGGVDFAIVQLTNQIFFMKMISMLKQKLSTMMTRYIRSYTELNSVIIKQIAAIISNEFDELTEDTKKEIGYKEGDNKEDYLLAVIKDFISSMRVEFPSLNPSTDESVSTNLDNHLRLIDTVLDTMLSDEAVSSSVTTILEENNISIAQVKGLIKNTLARRFIVENNILPETLEFLGYGDNAKREGVLEDSIQHEVRVKEALTNMFVYRSTENSKTDAKIKNLIELVNSKLGEVVGEAGDSGGSSYDDTSTDEDSSGSDEVDSFDFDTPEADDDGGAVEEETEETTTEESDEEEEESE